MSEKIRVEITEEEFREWSNRVFEADGMRFNSYRPDWLQQDRQRTWDWLKQLSEQQQNKKGNS